MFLTILPKRAHLRGYRSNVIPHRQRGEQI